MFAKACVLALCLAVINANPTDSPMEEMRSLCANDDTLACINYKFMSFLNTVFEKDSYKLSDNVEVARNEYRANEVNDARSESNFEDLVKTYIQSHDVTFKLPFGESSVKVEARNLDDNELDFKLKFSDFTGLQGARNSKLNRIIVPIIAFILFKAFTLIPLGIGVFGLGTVHALQFSFWNLILAVGMTVYQWTKKLNGDNSHHPHAAQGPWEQQYQQRSFDNVIDNAQQMAYNAYQ